MATISAPCYTTKLMVGPRYRAVFGRHLELSTIGRRVADPEAIESLGELDRLPRALLPPWVVRRPPLPMTPLIASNLRRVHAAGITIAAGTDAGNIGTLHGPSLHRELELMVEAEPSPIAALTAATRGGAAVMGRSDQLGTLEPGKLADLVNRPRCPADPRGRGKEAKLCHMGHLLMGSWRTTAG
jgi:hypothetical protein